MVNVNFTKINLKRNGCAEQRDDCFAPRAWSPAALRNVLWFRKGLKGKAKNFNWHNVVGFWMAVPLFMGGFLAGVLVVNSRFPSFFSGEKYQFIESLGYLAGGAIKSAKIYSELKDSMQIVEELEIY